MDQATLVDAKEHFDTWRGYRFVEVVGEDLLSRLAKANVPITDAYWAMSDDGEMRRLFIATPLWDSVGLRKSAYYFHSALYSLSDEERCGLTMSDISIVSPQSENVLAMRRRYGKVDDGVGYRIRPIDQQLSSPFIYFLNRAANEAQTSQAQGNGTNGTHG